MSDGDLNVYLDPGPFGEVIIEDTVIACTLIEIDGCANPEDWSVQKGTGSSGATESWKGMKLCESIKLKFRAHDDATFQAMSDMLLLVRPTRGQKPPTVNVTNGWVNWSGVTQMSLKQPPTPKWDAKSQATDFEWEFQEHGPSKPTNTGPAGEPAPDAKDPPTAQSAADKEIEDLTRKVAKL